MRSPAYDWPARPHWPAERRPASSTQPTRSPFTPSSNGRLSFLGIPEVIDGTLQQLPGAPIRAFETLYEADREARAVAGELIGALAA